MHEYLPLLIVGGIIGLFSTVLILAFAMVKDKKEAMGFDRKMKDGVLMKRLLRYAKPYWKNFAVVGVVMLVSIAYDIVAPLLVSDIEGMVKADFQLPDLIWKVVLYASILVISLASTYAQALILQKTG
ncbi:MAG: hypothetical protein ACI4QL_03440, partial [Candidatus Fimimonas sp.]